jgi:hypothetical protein
VTLNPSLVDQLTLSLREQCSSMSEFYRAWESQCRRPETIDGAVRHYILGVLNRVLQLSDDTIFLIESERPIAASMCARGSIETAGMLLEFFRKLQSAVSRGDGPSTVSVVRNFMFASMEFGKDYSVSTPHVLNGIRALETRVGGIEMIYNILCETVHPNWAGRIVGDKLDDSASEKSIVRVYVSISSLSNVIPAVCSSAKDFSVFLDGNGSTLKKLVGSGHP